MKWSEPEKVLRFKTAVHFSSFEESYGKETL
jgi:hypothetical protein